MKSLRGVIILAFVLALVLTQTIGGGFALAATAGNTTAFRPTPTVNNTKVKEPVQRAPIRAASNATGIKPSLPVRAAGNITAAKAIASATEGVIKGTAKAVSADAIKIGDVSVKVVPETKYNVPGIKDAKLADIKVGMNVIAQVRKINGGAYAAVINVVPAIRHFVGKVTAYKYDADKGGRIAIKDKEGKTYSFEIVGGQFTIQPNGAAVKIGDQVTVLTQRVKEEDEPVAIGVIISIPVEHYSGNITAFNYEPATGGSISIQQKGGKNLTFNILAGKFTIQPKGVTVKVGQQATVTVQVVPGQSEPVATGVSVVIPPQRFAGKVTEFAYDPAKGGRIVILDKDGKKLSFDIEPGKFSVQPKDAVVKVDDMVTIIAQAREGKELVAIGVVIQPKPVSVKGIINNIDEAAKTITIGTTVVSYNDKTTFVLHRVLAVRVGLQAVATGHEQPDHSILAGNVSVEPAVAPSPQ